MADNATLQSAALATPPAGTVIAADDVSIAGTQPTGLVQWIKLADGTPNGTGYVPASTANGLLVDVSRVQGAVDTELPAASSLADNEANPSVPRVGSMAMVWDGATWDREAQPLTDAQLRASAVPVSDGAGSLTVDPNAGTVWDVSDRAAREAGRVRLWDGTDEATVLPRGTVPTASDKGVCVVPLNVIRPSYQVVTTEITSATTVGVKQNLHLWHPASLAKDVFIVEIGVNTRIVQTAGTFAWELSFTSAIGTGGTTATPQQLNNADPASGVEARIVQTGGGTLKGQIFQRASQPLPAAATPWVGYDGIVIYRAKDLDDYSDAILLRNGIAEGLNIQQNVIAALTTAPIFSIYARWVERA